MTAPRVVLHLGTPKTGTTYLQELMWHHREVLASHGVHYPGSVPEAHFQAAVDVQGMDFNDWHDEVAVGAWSRLVEQARGLSGTVVLSHELFGDASAETARRALEDLSFGDVHLVLTLRDLARQIPASWQEDLKNRHWMSYREFAEAVRPDTPTSDWYSVEFWRRQDVPAVLERWATTLPPDRVHLVTVPGRGAGQAELWRRFASVVGVSPDVVDTAHPELRHNRSLGRREAQLLRRVNLALEDQVPWPVYGEVMSHLAEHVLGQQPDPIVLPAEDRGWASACADRMVEALQASGHPVVGDLEELRVDAEPPPPGTPLPDDADDAELLQVAVDLLAEALFRNPVPPLETLAPPTPRSIVVGQRVLWQTYDLAVRARDRLRGVARRAR